MKTIILMLAVVCGSANADYLLITSNLDTQSSTVERFIAYSDCRKRGLRNQDIAGLFGGRAGFVCIKEGE